MRQIQYNLATNSLRFELPEEWSKPDLTALTLQIANKAGTELMAASAVTLYTATTLNGAVNRFSTSIALTTGATAVTTGDRLMLVGAGGSEVVTVRGYNSGTATLEGAVNNAYDDSDAVHGLWGTVTVDTTTVATWPAGLIVRLLWTPTGTGMPVTELAQIDKTSLDIEGLGIELNDTYPRAYQSFTDKNNLDRMTVVAKRELRAKLKPDGLDIYKMVDQDPIIGLMVCELAHLWTLSGDEQMNDEREAIGAELDRRLAEFRKNPFWIDLDQDGTEDDGEVFSAHPIFNRSH